MTNSLIEKQTGVPSVNEKATQAALQPTDEPSRPVTRGISSELEKEIGYLETHTLKGGLVPQ